MTRDTALELYEHLTEPMFVNPSTEPPFETRRKDQVVHLQRCHLLSHQLVTWSRSKLGR